MKMDVKIMVALFLLGLVAKGHAETFCYTCENCPDGNNLPENLLVACGADGSETTTEGQPSSPTTVQTVEPPIETIAPTNPPPESSTTQTVSTSTQEPTQPSAEPSTETTGEPITEPATEPATQEPTTQETIPTTQSTTEQSPSLSTAPTPDTPISTTSAIPVTENTDIPTEPTTATNPSAPPTTTDRPTGTPPPSETARLEQSPVKQTAYNCYVLVNGTQHVNRGCVAASRYPNDMCRIANGLVLPLECRVCDTDKCNSSSRIVMSVFLLVFSIGFVLGL